MPAILVSGSVAYDILLGFEGSFTDTIRPEGLETLSAFHLSPHYVRQHGGTGANIAWGIATLKQTPLLVGAVGKDGKEYVTLLKKKGVLTKYVRRLDDLVTATAIIGTDSGERQIGFFHPGADPHSPWPDIGNERKQIGWAISSPRDVIAMMKCVAWCREHKIPVIFDPGQQLHVFGNDEVRRSMEQSSMMVVNEYEWNILQKKLDCDAKTVIQHVPIVIVTKGEKGLTYFDQDGTHDVAACRPQAVINPTGAGDALRAGLLSGLNAGWNLRQACQLGCAMGSFAVEIDGTLIEVDEPKAIFERAQEAYKEALPALAPA